VRSSTFLVALQTEAVAASSSSAADLFFQKSLTMGIDLVGVVARCVKQDFVDNL